MSPKIFGWQPHTPDWYNHTLRLMRSYTVEVVKWLPLAAVVSIRGFCAWSWPISRRIACSGGSYRLTWTRAVRRNSALPARNVFLACRAPSHPIYPPIFRTCIVPFKTSSITRDWSLRAPISILRRRIISFIRYHFYEHSNLLVAWNTNFVLGTTILF